MRILRFLISLSICICLVLTGINTWAMTGKSVDEYHMDLIKSLGIINEDSSIDAGSKITKEQFLRSIYNMCSLNDISDIAGTAYELGLINFSDKAKINLEESISYEEAVSITVAALGYNIAAVEKGGYPSGYIQVATSLKLGKGVDTSKSEMTYEDASEMLYNALECKMMGTNLSGKYELTEKNILNDVLKVYKTKGLVTGINGVSIAGEKITDDRYITIDTQRFEVGQTNAGEFLGQRVTYYYKNNEGDIPQLVYICSDLDEVITINSDMINKISNVKDNVFEIEYEDFKGNTYNKDIKPNYIILNNELVGFDTGSVIGLMTFELGNITLISSENNDIFDIVKIDKYENYVVNHVSNEYIYDKYNKEPIPIDLDQTKQIVNVLKDNKHITLGEIKDGDVVSVYKNSNMDLTLVVSDNSFEGLIEEIEQSENGNERLIIDGYPYNCYVSDSSISVGAYGTFYTDSNGNIAEVKLQTNEKYGYLIKMAKHGLGTADVKILTEDNGVKILNCGDITVQKGEMQRKYSAEELLDEYQAGTLFEKMAIKYSTNNDRLLKICAVSDTDDLTSNFTFSEYAEDAEYMYGKLGRYMIDPNKTKIFTAAKTEGSEDTYYNVGYTLSDEGEYDVEYYDVDEWNVPKLVVVKLDDVNIPTLTTAGTDPYNELAVIDSTSLGADDSYDSGYVVKIRMLYKGQKVTYNVLYGRQGLYLARYDENSRGSINAAAPLIDTTNIGNYLKQGDIVLPVFNNGIIIGMRKMYDAQTNNFTYSGTPGYNRASRHSSADFIYAKVDAVSTDKILVDSTNPNIVNNLTGKEIFPTKMNGHGYIYDKKNQRVLPATINDINVGDSIFLHYGNLNLRTFVIIR